MYAWVFWAEVAPLLGGVIGPSAAPTAEPVQVVQVLPSQVRLVAEDMRIDAMGDEVAAEINRLRTDPQGYADWLETQSGFFEGTVLARPGQPRFNTREGVAALQEAIATLRNQDALPPLEISEGMHQAAQAHANDLGAAGQTGNVGSDGASTGDRLQRYGTWMGNLLELQSYGHRSAEAVVMQLVLSDGDGQRRSRNQLLDPNLQQVGIGCQRHSLYQRVCVLNLATDFVNSDAVNARLLDEASEISEITEASETSVTLTPPPTHPSDTHLPPREQPTPQLSPSPLVETYLSELEAAIVAETNRLRSNPAAYAEELAALRPYYRADGSRILPDLQLRLQTEEGLVAVDDAIADLEDLDPLPILTPSLGLSKAAADQAMDLGQNNFMGHIGSDGSYPLERMNRYGTWEAIAGENISYVPEVLNTARWHIQQLIIDDNVPNRGHREALLRPDYRRIGVACEPHPSLGVVCVMTYAGGYQEHVPLAEPSVGHGGTVQDNAGAAQE